MEGGAEAHRGWAQCDKDFLSIFIAFGLREGADYGKLRGVSGEELNDEVKQAGT